MVLSQLPTRCKGKVQQRVHKEYSTSLDRQNINDFCRSASLTLVDSSKMCRELWLFSPRALGQRSETSGDSYKSMRAWATVGESPRSAPQSLDGSGQSSGYFIHRDRALAQRS